MEMQSVEGTYKLLGALIDIATIWLVVIAAPTLYLRSPIDDLRFVARLQS